jgi:hypothetical protein
MSPEVQENEPRCWKSGYGRRSLPARRHRDSLSAAQFLKKIFSHSALLVQAAAADGRSFEVT